MSDCGANGTRPDAWRREPVVWLGSLIVLASLTACVWLVIVSQRYADEPVPATGPALFRMPAARTPPPDREGGQ